MKNYFYLLILFSFASCNLTQNISNDLFKARDTTYDKVHLNKLEAGSTIVHTGKFHSFEKLSNGQFLLKYYLYENATNKIVQETYADETLIYREGKSMTWAVNGKKSSEGMYQNGMKIGEWKYFDKDTDNLIQLNNYQNGKKNGICKYYFDSGELSSEYTYQNGEMNGIYKKYKKGGVLYEEGMYQNGEIVGEEMEEEVEEEEAGKFKVVEQMPMFPGCEEIADIKERKPCADRKMLEFIYKSLMYPPIARENGIEGMVVVGFVVEKDGTLDNIQMTKNIGGLTEYDAFRVVNLMNTTEPKWAPGLQNDKPVKVHFNLPIKFRLE